MDISPNATIYGEDVRMGLLESSNINSNNQTTRAPSYLPSGYSITHITIACIVVIVILLEIIMGNILVIVAIVKDKHLKTRQNWLIASLSVADLCVGSLIMPLSLAYELMGYWPFGTILCEIWLIVDVMLCTSSVLNLCIISLDRYWCVTRPLSYPQKRTPKRMATMIALGWGLSAIICLPPVFGWKTSQPEEEFPQCFLSQELGYILYSISGSFFVPLIVTCAVYAKVLHVARSRARRNLPKTNTPREQTTVLTTIKEASSSASECSGDKNYEQTDSNDNQHDTSPSKCEHKSNLEQNQTTLVITELSAVKSNGTAAKSKRHSLLYQPASTNANVELPSKHCPVLCCVRRSRESHPSTTLRMPAAQESQRVKRKIAKARERRATITVGLIVFSFALCWLPFSLSYVIDSIGGFGFQYTVVFKVFFWLGYVNSGINPLLYTFFNRDFRLAFKKILNIK